MSVNAAVLWIIIGTALVTMIPRVVPLVLLSRMALPAGVVRWLGFVPIAVLSALLAQSVALVDGQLALPPQNLTLPAVVPTLLVAIYTRSLIGTVVAGVVTMALLRWVMG